MEEQRRLGLDGPTNRKIIDKIFNNTCRPEVFENYTWHGPPLVFQHVDPEHGDERNRIRKKNQTDYMMGRCVEMITKREAIVEHMKVKKTYNEEICRFMGYMRYYCHMDKKRVRRQGQEYIIWTEDEEKWAQSLPHAKPREDL
jgi:hypothetical protein